MKQPKSRKGREYTAALYPRLSRDDSLEGESYSISNQKQLLTKVAKEMGYTNLLIFTDDGVSGVTMNRPGFNDMMAELEKGYISAVFVKDMSRLGRNYIEVGRLMEEFFPEHDIRLVAVSDGIDTAEGENELAPIRNLFNEWYSRDISKKRRISNKIRGNAGEPMGPPPYGYMKDPDNPKRWVVDEEAASVVRRMFRMTLEGSGTEQVAAALENGKVLSPYFYKLSKGQQCPGKRPDRPVHAWPDTTVLKILTNQQYCGDVINFKTYSRSYKDKRRRPNGAENMVICKDAHEPVVNRADWEKVQSMRKSKTRKRPALGGEINIFSGLLVCADCGHNMHIHFNQRNHEIRYYLCSNYKGGRGCTCPATHYIRADFLEQVVIGELRRLTRFATKYEDEFSEIVMGHSKKAVESDTRFRQKELRALIARHDEIDGLFDKMYEDNVAGKISDDRFHTMSLRYESEQKELSDKIDVLKEELDKKDSKAMSTDMFIKTVRKYTRIKKLTPRILNELIGRIEVYHADKASGEHTQKLIIHYNCVGNIDIPNVLKLPEPEVRISTRQGVALNYAFS